MDGKPTKGECLQVEGANWTALSLQYSLEDTHPSLDLCSCGCRCMAKMPVEDVKPGKDVCDDVGCTTQWGGEAVCVDTSSNEFPQMVNDLDLSVGGKHGLCGDAGCCTCFKKKVASHHCPDVNCGTEWGGKGICLDPSSEDFYDIVDDLDLFVGGKKGLCGDVSCCTCFKKK